jgi:flavin-dependent dehydrogenase
VGPASKLVYYYEGATRTVKNGKKRSRTLIVGGGPAGSTAAILLAREEFDVVLMEKATFPRYHIGESLIPSTLEILTHLGIREKIEAFGFVRKPGVYLEWGNEKWSVNFSDLPGQTKHSFQVKRDDFDHLLLQHAKSQGAKVFEGREVREVSFDGNRACVVKWTEAATGESGELPFDYLIDASGRSGLLANRYLRARRHHESFQNIAVWGYWTGVGRSPDGRDGAICVGSIPDGWFWAIPLHDGTTSVGLVIHKSKFKKLGRTSDEAYHQAIRISPLMTKLLQKARLVSELKTDQDYSYATDVMCGEGFFIIGDAACFLDPLFSTGVHLAVYSGLLASASLASILREEIGQEEALTFFEKCYRQAFLRFMFFVSAFYDQTRGKDAYYQEAKGLSRRDYSAADAKDAFLHLISGLEDLSDAQEGIDEIIIQEVAERARSQSDFFKDREALKERLAKGDPMFRKQAEFMKALEGTVINAPSAAVNGLYLKTIPRLGLARIGDALPQAQR